MCPDQRSENDSFLDPTQAQRYSCTWIIETQGADFSRRNPKTQTTGMTKPLGDPEIDGLL